MNYLEAHDHVQRFVHDVVRDLSTKHRVPEPNVRIGIGVRTLTDTQLRLSSYWPEPTIRTAPKTIAISTVWVDFAMADITGTEMALDYSLTHEFYHYLRDLKGLLPKKPVKPEIQAEEEKAAHEFAFKETGRDLSLQIHLLNNIMEKARPLMSPVIRRIFLRNL